MAVFGSPIGIQLMAELWECNKERIDDPKKIEEAMQKAAQESGAQIIGSMFHE